MLLTNADTAKRLLVDLLQAQTGTSQPLYQVQVDYTEPGQETLRELIYPGPVSWTNDGDTEIRLEVATIPLVVRVVDPGKDLRDVEQRVKTLAAVAQSVVEANPKPLGSSTWWAIVGGQLSGVRTGDESVATLTLQVEVRSYV